MPMVLLRTQRVQANMDRLDVHEGLVTQNIADIATNADGIAANAGVQANMDRLDVHEGLVTTNIANIAANAEGITANAAGIQANVDRLDVHEGLVTQNMADIAANSTAISNNMGMIQANAADIRGLGQEVDVIRSGVAATLAAAGMPMAPGAGWGFAVGTGHFDGESAIAAGLTFSGEETTFKISVGSSGGESTISAGFARSL